MWHYSSTSDWRIQRICFTCRSDVTDSDVRSRCFDHQWNADDDMSTTARMSSYNSRNWLTVLAYTSIPVAFVSGLERAQLRSLLLESAAAAIAAAAAAAALVVRPILMPTHHCIGGSDEIAGKFRDDVRRTDWQKTKYTVHSVFSVLLV